MPRGKTINNKRMICPLQKSEPSEALLGEAFMLWMTLQTTIEMTASKIWLAACKPIWCQLCMKVITPKISKM